MKTLKISLLLMVLTTIVFLTCRNTGPKIIKTDPAFAKWVSGYTGGNVSKKSPIRIELAQPFSPKGSSWLLNDSLLPDSQVLEKILDFEPRLKGHAKWINSRVIEFTPEGPMQSGTLYTVTFNLSKVADVPEAYKEMQFQFKTWPQVLNVEVSGLENYNQFHAREQYITGTIKTTDLFDTAEFRHLIHAKQHGRKLPLRWVISENDEEEETENNPSYTFYFDSVIREEKAGKVTVSWDGDAIGAQEEGEKELTVSALSDFSLSQTIVKDNGSQTLELRFSDPIFPAQDFNHFISVEGNPAGLRFQCNANVVTAYFEQRIIGNRKIIIQKGLLSAARAPMAKAQETQATFLAPKPLARFHGKGSILPNSQGLRIPLETINLKAVDIRVIKIYENNIHQFLQVNNLDGEDGLSRVGKVVLEKKIELGVNDSVSLNRWTRHVLDLGNLIKTDLGSIYRISIKFKASYTGCGCEGEHEAYGYYNAGEEEEEDESLNEGSFAQNIDYDYRYYSEDQDGYSDNEDPCTNQYYQGKALNRNILASDLGVIAKMEPGRKTYISVRNLINTEPVKGATAEIYDYTKQLLGTAITDENGMAAIEPAGRPFLLIAKYGNQRGYLKLTPGTNNSMSRFETDGETARNGMKGYLYGERGVWRPGDSIFLTFMLEPGIKPLPAAHPYTFELTGPEGQVMEKQDRYLKDGNLDVIRFATAANAPTGDYSAAVKLGNLKITKNISIQTIKPNHLKIKVELPEDGMGAEKKEWQVPMQVKWLQGAVAANLRAEVELNMRPAKTVFSKFKTYTFESPLRKRFAWKNQILDGHLDAGGKASLKVEMNGLKQSPGALTAAFVSRVYENNGDMNIDRSETTVHPFENYIGLDLPGNTDDVWLSSGRKHWFDVVSIARDQKLKSARNLKVSVYHIAWKWWYEQESEEEQNYLSRPATYLYMDTLIQAPQGKSGFWFGIPSQEWGRYLIVVSDPSGGHESGAVVNFDYPYWGRQNGLENDGATFLSLSTDKSIYRTGENVQVTFPSAAGSKALVSVETSRKVVKQFWVNAGAGETHASFAVTPEMTPTAYVHVTLIQPHLQTINDRPIRMYGVVPVEVTDPSTRLNPVITSANTFKPDNEEIVAVSEATGKGMYYTLAVVDEGLLDLTHFRTPDPHQQFFAKEALGVKTWDIYQHVIGAYAGKMDHLLSIGGDGGYYDEESAGKARRFKPVVKFLGPFKLAPGGRALHKIKIENYTGSVRIMVVGRQNRAFGNAEKAVEVKQPLMVLGTLPRVLGPNEKLRIPVTVFAMEKNIRDVKVTLQITGDATLSSSATQQIRFSGPGEEMVYFDLKTLQATGVLKVSILASSGTLTAKHVTEIGLRAPNPVESRTTDISLKPGESSRIPFSWFGLKGSNTLQLIYGNVPLYGIGNRLDYLVEYPHGCIEQTTSAVFAQLYLGRVMNLSPSRQAEIETNVKAALNRYRLFQTRDGGFSYWPGEEQSSTWGSNYAGHFLLEAEKAGYKLPEGMKDKWVAYERGEAKTWKYEDNPYVHPHGNESFENLQAFRLYLLALAGQPEMGAMNLLREKRDLGTLAAWELASAYAMAGRADVAKTLGKTAGTSLLPYRELGYTYGSDLRDRAMMLEAMTQAGFRSATQPIFDEIAGKLNSGMWMSTQEAACCLKAVCAWSGASGSGSMDLQVTDAKGKNLVFGGRKNMGSVILTDAAYSINDFVTVKNTGSSILFIRQLRRGAPLSGSEFAENRNLEMQWEFIDKNGHVFNPDAVEAGTDFQLKINLKNPGKQMYREMCLKSVLPSGWEIMDNQLYGYSGAAARYANVRDDRVYFYYDLGPGEKKTFTLQLHASYEGEFYLPGPYSEAMYDAGIRAAAKGKMVKVTKSENGI